jgi:hypothetical protein
VDATVATEAGRPWCIVAHLVWFVGWIALGENTKMLQILQALCARHGLALAHDPQGEQLAGVTEATVVLAELHKHLPEQ